MINLIDRNKVIDAIDDISVEVDEGYGFQYEKWRKYFCDLPWVQESNLINIYGLEEEIRCTMCKNPMRTDRGCDGGCKYDEKLYADIMEVLHGRIKQLPSTKPRKGKWIIDNPHSDMYRYTCSVCKAQHRARYDLARYNFCPNCGSYNGGRNEA